MLSGFAFLDAATPTPVAATWFHVAITWDGTTKQLWVGGESVATASVSGLQFDSNPVTFGADIDNGVQDVPMTGILDDVRIYSRALSAEELAALAAQ